MQAYSLMKALEGITHSEIEIEVIDYISPNHIRRYGTILTKALCERNIEKLKQFLEVFIRNFWKIKSKNLNMM